MTLQVHTAPRPRNEAERLAALRGYEVLDTAPEAAFDDITSVAATITGAPVALISLVDAERLWFKSRFGQEATQIPRDTAFCAHAILSTSQLIVPDTATDPRFMTNPHVVADPSIRFYAGTPLTTDDGLALGTLCVMDYRPRDLPDAQRAALAALARQVMKELDLRRSLQDLSAAVTGRRRAQTPEVLQSILDRAPAVAVMRDTDGRFIMVNAAFERLYGVGSEQVVGKRPEGILAEPLARVLVEHDGEVMENSESLQTEFRVNQQGRELVFEAVKFPLVDWSGKPYAAATIATDITERVRLEQNLRYHAEHDPLTGLRNRRGFDEDLQHHLRRLKRYGGTGAVLVLDIDNFKTINDSYGHAVGDQYLAAVTREIGDRLREDDVLARLGGDEFGVLLAAADLPGARAVATAILEHVRRFRISMGERTVSATLSVGGCLLTGAETSADEALITADLAMYEAKELGRDRMLLIECGGQQRQRAVTRSGWGERIRHALAQDGFRLHAQPIVDIQTGVPAHHELLIRMIDADGELLPPGAFLPAAERLDLVQALDRWVLDTAVRLLAAESGEGRSAAVAVNMSARSLRQAEIIDLIENLLAESSVDPAQLIVEVTETAAIANMAEAQVFAGRLQSMGCRFALDDFGAGFGSFYYVKHLPIDMLKIDGDFVRDLATSRFDQIVVDSVVQIGQELNCATVGEFVESEQSLELLRQFGVTLAQGFHLEKPQPLEVHFPSAARRSPFGLRH